MSSVVEVEHLTKTYGNLVAVDKMSFAIEAEKIYGLLGRNGAGKTTIMQMLTAQIFATSGELRVFGEKPYENRRVLKQICFMRENQKYPDGFRVEDVLELSPAFFPRWDREYARALSEDFQLPLKRKMKALSKGMRSAVGIVVGLASRAPLTIFDEPSMSLDVVARSQFYHCLIEDYTQHPRTIILSTHLIDEVSRLLEHVLVIDKGKLVLDEDTDILRSRAFTVTGSAAKVEAFTVGKTLIGGEQFGSLVSATLLGEVDVDNRKQATALGLEFTSVSLQQLIVHLTSGTSQRKMLETR